MMGKVEYVEEAAFAITPESPVMQWMGLVERFTPTIRTMHADTRYMAASGTQRLGAVLATKTGQDLVLTARILPQSLSFWASYALGSSAGTADSLPSISVGHITDTGYGVYRGCVVRSAKLTFRRDEPALLDITWLAAHFDGYSGEDYIGTGAHAPASTASPLVWSDLAALTWGSDIGDYVQELSIGVEYELRAVRDVGATTSTGIVALVPTRRDIVVSLTLDLDDCTMLDAVRSLTKHDLVATISGSTCTIAGVAFPELAAELTADDLVEATLESVPCESISVR